MSGRNVLAAELGAPPADRPFLHVTVRWAGRDSGLGVEPLWEADLVQGAVVEVTGTSADMHDDWGGTRVDGRLPDGELVENLGGGMGAVRRGQVFTTMTDPEIREHIAAALTDFGLPAVSFDVLHPLGAAPAVVATALDPKAILESYAKLVRALFSDGRSMALFEGYYLELRDTDGNALVCASASFRTTAGRIWRNPTYPADTVGVPSGGAPR